jgi:putative DNA primase/helicase
MKYKPGDFVEYTFNRGHGARKVTGRIVEYVSPTFVKIDDDIVPLQVITGKIEVIETEYLDFKTIVKAAQDGELGSARMFAELMAGRVIYDHSEKEWYFWNDTYWQQDKTKRIINTITEILATQYTYALATAYKTLESKVINSLNYISGINNVLTLAAAQQSLSITSDRWDNDPWVIGCLNGVLDLKTGDTRPGEPEDGITILGL